MVMSLRTRVPLQIPRSPSRSPSPSPSPVRRTRNLRKREAPLSTTTTRTTRSKTNTKKPRFPGKENAAEYDESESSGEDSSGSESEEEEEECEYEKIREQRIKENRERMEKLGIMSMLSQFNAVKKNKTKTTISNKKKPRPVSKPRNPPLFQRVRSYDSRRSDRLMNILGGKYVESERALRDMGISIPDSWTPEVYTDEHVQLLGDCETKWDLNVDGYGEDGDRLYDPVNGTSCHQCRQKTVRKHTCCPKCRSPQGQLCGDCLYTRYGENVLEAAQNPSWMCPACRGICNCSRCRRAKGWPPVTILYPKVIESGFKSVAHYLILSRRSGTMPTEAKGNDVEGETQAPLRYEDSDTSVEWSESESDVSNDDNSHAAKKTSTQSASEDAEASSEAAKDASDAAADQIHVSSISDNPTLGRCFADEIQVLHHEAPEAH